MKKKRILSILIITCMLTSSWVYTPSSAVETSTTTTSYTDETTGDTVYVTSDGFEYIITENSEVCITKYTGNEIDLVIPEEIDGRVVTKISPLDFNGIIYANPIVKTVTLPSTIKVLMRSFAFCENLQEINLNEGLEEIGVQSFDECSNLRKIIVPSTVKNLGMSAVDWNYLEEITVLSLSISNIEYYGYTKNTPIINCYQNTELYNSCIQNNLTTNSLGIYVPENFEFYYKINADNSTITVIGCNFENIVNITIPETIDDYTVTGLGGFAYYPFLETFNMPDTITTINAGCFRDCDNLKNVKLSKNILKMPSAISQLAIEHSDATKKIYIGTFESCNSLQKLIIPPSMTYLDYNFLKYCKNLEKLVIPTSVTDIADYLNTNVDAVTYNGAIHKTDNLVIYTYPNAFAIDYAIKKEIPYKIIGDIGNDNNISSDDALSLLQHTIGLYSLNEEQTEMCDFDLDNKVTSSDALKILQYTVGLINSLY